MEGMKPRVERFAQHCRDRHQNLTATIQAVERGDKAGSTLFF
jgi:hypothetical protein